MCMYVCMCVCVENLYYKHFYGSSTVWFVVRSFSTFLSCTPPLSLPHYVCLTSTLSHSLSVSFWMQVQVLCAEKRLHFDPRHLHWPNWSPKCWSSSALSIVLLSPLILYCAAWASSTLSSSPNPSPSLWLTVANCNCSYCSCSWLWLWLCRWLWLWLWLWRWL